MKALLLLSVLAQSPGAARRIDVVAAERLALEHSPALHMASSRAESMDDQSRSLRGRMLPGVFVSDEHQRYSEPFTITFNLGVPGVPSPSLIGRELNTNTFVAAAQQPLLGLLHLWQDKAGLDDAALAAHQVERITTEAISEAVQTGYLKYFEGKAAEDVAKASIAQLEEQRQVTEARVKAGAATNADVLRLDVAVANAKQQLIVARAQQEMTYSALLLAMGYTAQDADIELLEPTALEAGEVPPLNEVDAQRSAAAGRPEVERARLEQSAAEHQATARFLSLLPEANLEAAYMHMTGQAFAPPDSMYVGVKASWNVWEWGASWYQRQAAVRNAEAVAAAREEQVRVVMTDASTKLAVVRSAHAAVGVAETAITSAEEAWRVTQALLKAGAATTTDLLDAQAALTQAKLNLVRARSQQAVALVGLKRAVGIR